jgi:hypothetical protein
VAAQVTRQVKSARHGIEGGGDGHPQTMRNIAARFLIPRG